MNAQDRSTLRGMESTYNAPFHKLLRMFTFSILISFVGTWVGMYTPPALMLPLVIVELVMLVAAFFIRRRGKSIGYTFVYAFCFVSGITIFPNYRLLRFGGRFFLGLDGLSADGNIFGDRRRTLIIPKRISASWADS